MNRPRTMLASTVILVGLATVTGCGLSDSASATSEASDPVTSSADSTDDDTGVFVATVLHDIAVTFDEADYQALLMTYADTGEKEWIEATVTIDGVTYERVGLRLKGNSSLAGLGRQGQDGSAGQLPEELPWLIRLDRVVEGQTHHGHADIVVRSNNSETSLNEAVALTLLDEVGLASQEAAFTSFSVNGGDGVLRLVVEHPDDDRWQETSFDGAGALYKAESTGDWSWRGEVPESYNDIFDQEGGEDVADLTPLIEFLDFVNNSDDETFAAELPERLDVDAFATYLAMMELIDNLDDIAGPGNNAYLWWDVETEQFTVVPWDMNLALGGTPGGGGSVGGGRPDIALPDGVEPPPDSLPEGMEPPNNGGAPPFSPPGDRGPAGMGMSEDVEAVVAGGDRSNPLVERFHDDEDFEALYQDKLATLRTQLVDSGVAEEILDAWSDTLTSEVGGLVDEDTIVDEATTIRSSLVD